MCSCHRNVTCYQAAMQCCGLEKNGLPRDFPGGPGLKTSPSSAEGAGSIPGWGSKTPHVSQPKSQNIKQKQYCNKFSKDFENGPH